MLKHSNASRILHRQLGVDYPTAVGGEGAFIIDGQGEKYLDASGGAAVSCLGHGHPAVIDAIKAQLDTIAFAHTGFFTNQPAEELAEWLIDRGPDGMGKVYFVSGGSEATEAALKLTRQVHVERGEPQRDRIVSRLQSYHGNTLGALSVGGNLMRRKPFEPILLDTVSHIPPCYAYRHRHAGESDEDYGLRAAKALEDEILRLGQDRVMAFVAETVVGATLGAVAPVPGYFKEIRRICDAYGVFLILDEVMCGMGRTGTLFACEQDGVVPDIVTMAKGLGGGYQPIGAFMVRQGLIDTLESGSGLFQHGHTYIGHATACAAGLAVQKVIRDENLLERVVAAGADLKTRLQNAFADHSNVGDVRGRGLFIGIELVADRDSKTPFEADAKVAAKIKKAAMQNRLVCYPGNGTADGISGDHILLAPPYIIDEDIAQQIVDRVAKSIDEAIGTV